ncbi:MAG: fumarylacetoacetate hydrolase family protein [Hydrogenophaga sp.]|uniref:fumarylacetoacetate hydrolase family protein n=1 Tax=Hydrogenophaga sp. TaxID=1904254 RepID=UPI00257EB9E8|nr:fumarylacetoacetate hydrolase family protein [Hydrogenophaga sp.]MBL0945145.1 fumarylacetoacetate hydrolase family protein [Hydrogenophaga sp.]
MRLITFESAGQQRLGAWIERDTRIVDLHRAAALLDPAGGPDAALGSMQALMESGEAGLDRARQAVARAPEEAVLATDDVRILAPVPRPIQMRDSLAFELHLRQAKRANAAMRLRHAPDAQEQLAALERSGGFEPAPIWFKQPVYYKCNRFNVVGTGHDIEWPAYSEVLDYELELGIFLGRGGKDIPAGRARSHIFGYTVYNDVSARDAQADEMPGMLGPAKGKDFDTGNVLGPCIVTADEIADPYALTMTARINGELWSQGSSATMYHRFEDIIAHVSASETLLAGEFIGSGTVGNGCGFELGRYPQAGDVMELAIEGIGTLRNRIVRPARA